MRHTCCQFYNEKIEVLADRYQRLVGKTEKHVAADEGKAAHGFASDRSGM